MSKYDTINIYDLRGDETNMNLKIKMNKKNIFYLAVIILLLIIVVYYRPIQVSDLISPYNSEILPDKIDSYIYFTPLSGKELSVTKTESIREIITLLNNMKVSKKLIFPNPYHPEFKSTYNLLLYRGSNKKQSINILNSTYIEINHKPYMIIGKPNLSSIYKTIILDQPEGLLDEFYYDIIDAYD